RCKRGTRSKSDRSFANIQRLRRPKAGTCRFLLIRSRETTPRFLARFWIAGQIPTPFFHRVAVRIFSPCCRRSRCAVMLKKTGILPSWCLLLGLDRTITCALCLAQVPAGTGRRAGRRCLHWILPQRRVTGGRHKFFSAAGHRRIGCASKFLSLCNGSPSLRTVYRCITRNVRPADQVIRRKRANL